MTLYLYGRLWLYTHNRLTNKLISSAKTAFQCINTHSYSQGIQSNVGDLTCEYHSGLVYLGGYQIINKTGYKGFRNGSKLLYG